MPSEHTFCCTAEGEVAVLIRARSDRTRLPTSQKACGSKYCDTLIDTILRSFWLSPSIKMPPCCPGVRDPWCSLWLFLFGSAAPERQI